LFQKFLVRLLFLVSLRDAFHPLYRDNRLAISAFCSSAHPLNRYMDEPIKRILAN